MRLNVWISAELSIWTIHLSSDKVKKWLPNEIDKNLCFIDKYQLFRFVDYMILPIYRLYHISYMNRSLNNVNF